MRRKVKFGDLIKFSAGTNLTRLSSVISDDCIYTLEDFDYDLCSLKKNESDSLKNVVRGKGTISTAGDVLISVTRNQAGIVSIKNSGKYLNSNFIKCVFDKEKIYPWYFCYLINESTMVSKQIKKLQQGTLGCINRLTMNMIESLEFTMEEMPQQIVIGDLYRNLLVQERLTLKYLENMKKYTLQMIKNVDSN